MPRATANLKDVASGGAWATHQPHEVLQALVEALLSGIAGNLGD